jgi:hypothetical protein
MHWAYGNYTIANTFREADGAPDLPESEAPMFSAAFEDDPSVKRHAACDECRKRKLKCSGDPAGCERCTKHSLTCHYSKQAQMGRPRKKRKTSEEAEPAESFRPQVVLEQPIQPIVPDFLGANARPEFEKVCPAPYAQYVKNMTPAPPPPWVTQGPLMAASSDGTPPTESPPTPTISRQEAAETAYAKEDVANWPDFSTMTMLPQIVQDNHPPRSTSGQYTHSVDTTGSIQSLSTAPSCPCLPNIYLTLSSLSTLASFPISVHTIESLQTAHRTAQSVLYCTICPTKFQSGMQNVMMSGTLLTVLADNWHRVRTATAEELRSGFSPPRSNTILEEAPLTDIQSLEWRTFGYHLLRANVFGDKVTPYLPCAELSTKYHTDSIAHGGQGIQECHRLASINSSSSTPTLIGLIDAMERRQSAWHGKIPDTGEFPEHMSQTAFKDHMRGLTLDQVRELEMDENGHLCLKIVERARSVVSTLNQPAPTLA